MKKLFSKHTIRDIIYLRDLLAQLVDRDMKLRYKRSVLGFAWSLLNPLAQLLVFTFIFQKVLPLKIAHYSSFLFTGLLVWNWFQSSLYAGTGTIVDNRELVRRPAFPYAILPVVTVTTNFLHFLLALPVLLVFLPLNGVSLTFAVLLSPALFFVQFLLTLGLVYLIATIHVFFRDTQYLLGIILLLGFYLTPVFYSSDALPAGVSFWLSLNPMAILLNSYRELLLYGKIPPVLPLFILGMASIFLLGVGFATFRRASNYFVEQL